MVKCLKKKFTKNVINEMPDEKKKKNRKKPNLFVRKFPNQRENFLQLTIKTGEHYEK